MLTNVILGDKIIPLSRIKSLVINESILSPIIEGSIIFDMVENKNDVIDYSNIELKLTFYDKIKDYSFALKFLVYAENKSEFENNVGEKNVNLKFSSIYSVEMFNIQKSDYYKSLSYDTILKKLLSELNIKPSKFFIKTKDVFDVCLPLYTYIQNMRWLIKFCLDTNGRGGFLLFPDLKSGDMNFVNYNYLYNKNLGDNENPLVSFHINGSDYIGSVDNLVVIQDFDYIGSVNSGLNGFIASSFDFETGKVVTIEKNIKEMIGADKTLKGKIVLDKKYIEDKKYFNNMSFPNYSETRIKSLLNNDFYNSINDTMKLQCEAVGDYNRKLGSMVKLVVQSDYHNNVDTSLTDEYLIYDIQHSFNSTEYKQGLRLCKQSHRVLNGSNLVKFG